MILFLCAPEVLTNLDQVSIKMIQKRLWNVAMNIFRWVSKDYRPTLRDFRGGGGGVKKTTLYLDMLELKLYLFLSDCAHHNTAQGVLGQGVWERQGYKYSRKREIWNSFTLKVLGVWNEICSRAWKGGLEILRPRSSMLWPVPWIHGWLLSMY